MTTTPATSAIVLARLDVRFPTCRNWSIETDSIFPFSDAGVEAGHRKTVRFAVRRFD